MIKLNDNYYIGFDSMNVTLYSKKTRGEKSKKEGAEYLSTEGYFGSFEKLIASLLQSYVSDEKDIENLNDLIKSINDFKADILKSIVDLKPDTTPYQYKLETDIKE